MLSFPWNSVLHVACTAFFDKALLLAEPAWRRALFHMQGVQLLVASALLVCSAALGGNERGFAHHLGVAGFIVAAVWTAWLTWIILRRKT